MQIINTAAYLIFSNDVKEYFLIMVVMDGIRIIGVDVKKLNGGQNQINQSVIFSKNVSTSSTTYSAIFFSSVPSNPS